MAKSVWDSRLIREPPMPEIKIGIDKYPTGVYFINEYSGGVLAQRTAGKLRYGVSERKRGCGMKAVVEK